MKKTFKVISLIFLSLFVVIGYENVSAYSYGVEKVNEDNNEATYALSVTFDSADVSRNFNKAVMEYNLINLNLDDVIIDNAWHIEEINGNKYNLKTTKINEGKFVIATFKVSKTVDSWKNCYFSPSIYFISEPRYCTVYADAYYGKNGNIVTKEEYENQCFEKKYCVVENTESSESGPIYYGKNGNIVTKEEYEEACEEKYYCAIKDGNYYGLDGKKTTELNYQKECDKHYCEILSDGTMYGISGEILTDNELYEAQCNQKFICEIIDNVYYGKDGNIITKELYDEECSSVVENPKTGAVISVGLITFLGLSGFGIYYYAKKRDRFI